MSVPGIKEIQTLAVKYSKPQLAHMAQTGLIDTQKAVLAAMMRDRIAKEDAKPPTSTVAQDVMGLQPPQMAQPQMAQAAPQGMPQQPPQMGMQQEQAPVAPEQMAATGGLTSIPIESQDYAGGGIVAFASGGDTKREGQYEYVFDPATGTYKEINAPKEIPIPKDTRQHIGPAGYGLFGSEGMNLITGLPKGNLRDPVLGFAKGGDTPYKVYDYQPSLIEETPISSFDLEKIRQQEAAKAFGIDPEFYKKRGEEVGVEREKLTKERGNVLADALIVGGLGVAAGNSPYALQNIATGATKGFETYQGQIKDIRERDKALIESQNRIKEAEYLRSIGQADAADKAIQESKKLNREAKNMNIGIKNEVAKETAKSQTDASKTGFTEKMANERVNAQIAAQKEIAKLPPAELRMVQALNDQETKKAIAENRTPPSLMETFEAMNISRYKGYAGNFGKSFQNYTDEWTKMKQSDKIAFQELYPEIKTPAQYAAFMVDEEAKKNPRAAPVGGANPPPAGTRTPPLLPGFTLDNP